MPHVTPFPVHVPDDEIALLRARLDSTRLPEPQTVDDPSQGVELDRMTQLLDAWRRHDWRSVEKRWNAIPHFAVTLDGLRIAFWHVRSPEPDAVPLVLTHGWPGSPLEFEDVIGPLTDPARHGGSAKDAFHVVIPSLPGFGFSERPSEPGWDLTRTAHAWVELMRVLGYERFGAHGTDWGSILSIEIARLYPHATIGLHVTMPQVEPLPEELESATESEKQILARRERYLADEVGYLFAQSTRPQTIGYSLVDSPVGLAAWLSEKMVAYSDTRPEAGGGVTLDQQLDNIALYWFTKTGASSARWYWETWHTAPETREQAAGTIAVPTTATIFPGEPFPFSRRWVQRRFVDLVAWNEVDYGGHYAGWEQPEALVAAVRGAFAHARSGDAGQHG